MRGAHVLVMWCAPQAAPVGARPLCQPCLSSARGSNRSAPRPFARCRLWFVRMPRPPEAGALKGLEQEVDTYRTQFNLITEALNVKKVGAWGHGCRA